MAGLLYFIPGAQPGVAKLPELRKLGLGYAFDEPAGAAQVTRGPSGQPGVIVADKATVPEQQRGYFPDRQRWLAIPGNEHGVQVGLTLAAPPAPAELARPQMLPGHLVKLADGHAWHAPVARQIDAEAEQIIGHCVLPMSLGFDAAGQWTATSVQAMYQPLWTIAVTWWNAVIAAEETEEGATVSFAGLLDSAVTALQANYRVSRAECVLLELLTVQHARGILNALIDYPTILVWLKKKQEA